VRMEEIFLISIISKYYSDFKKSIIYFFLGGVILLGCIFLDGGVGGGFGLEGGCFDGVFLLLLIFLCKEKLLELFQK